MGRKLKFAYNWHIVIFLSSITNGASPKERIINLVKWFLLSLHAGKRVSYPCYDPACFTQIRLNVSISIKDSLKCVQANAPQCRWHLLNELNPASLTSYQSPDWPSFIRDSMSTSMSQWPVVHRMSNGGSWLPFFLHQKMAASHKKKW